MSESDDLFNTEDEANSDCDVIENSPVRQKKQNVLKQTFHHKYEISFEQYDLKPIPISNYCNLDKVKPHVFCAIPEILNFNSNNFPVHNNFQIVGIIKYDRKHRGFLFDHTNKNKILLDLSFLHSEPQEFYKVSLFGCLALEHFNRKNIPFQVRSWRYEDCDLTEYMKILKKIRQLTPKEYFKTFQPKETENDDALITNTLIEEFKKDLTLTSNN